MSLYSRRISSSSISRSESSDTHVAYPMLREPQLAQVVLVRDAIGPRVAHFGRIASAGARLGLRCELPVERKGTVDGGEDRVAQSQVVELCAQMWRYASVSKCWRQEERAYLEVSAEAGVGEPEHLDALRLGSRSGRSVDGCQTGALGQARRSIRYVDVLWLALGNCLVGLCAERGTSEREACGAVGDCDVP